MKFPIELAEKVVDMLHSVTQNNVNFMDEKGTIIAAIQKNRIGTIHEGAKRIMLGEIDELAITVEEADKLKGVMPGYNGVIYLNQQRIGCIGLSGDPIKMRPLQQLASIIVREEYEKYISDRKRESMIEKVAGEIQEMSAAMEEITAGSVESLHHIKLIEERANGAEKYLKNIKMVLDTVKKIADKTKLLGLNASIEAARAGAAGRGFTVVSKEIGQLSHDSMEAVKNINQTMQEVSNSIINIAQGVRDSSSIIEQQSSAMESISANVLEIQGETDNLMETENII